MDKNTPTPPDPEMLKNLELLLSMDAIEAEADWDEIESIEERSDQDKDDL